MATIYRVYCEIIPKYSIEERETVTVHKLCQIFRGSTRDLEHLINNQALKIIEEEVKFRVPISELNFRGEEGKIRVGGSR